MAQERDAVALGATVQRISKDFVWPGGKRIAVIFNIAYEGWSDGKTPGIGPMGNPLPSGTLDTNALSWAAYGPNRGIHRLTEGIGRSRHQSERDGEWDHCRAAPDTVGKLAAKGHEVLAHSYAMDVVPTMLSEEQEPTISNGRQPSSARPLE